MSSSFPYDSFVIILSAPSGAGKGTLANMLISRDDKIKVSVSATTRDKRNGEVHGEHYYFLTKEEFKGKIGKGEFLEYAEVFGNYYGTLKAPVEDMLSNGRDVIFDIDYQGGELITKNFDNKRLLKIFILPPSKDELRSRIAKRGRGDSVEDVENRLSKAAFEAEHYKDYDYVVVNDDIEKAYGEIKAIIDAKRLSLVKKEFVDKFIEDKLK